MCNHRWAPCEGEEYGTNWYCTKCLWLAPKSVMKRLIEQTKVPETNTDKSK